MYEPEETVNSCQWAVVSCQRTADPSTRTRTLLRVLAQDDKKGAYAHTGRYSDRPAFSARLRRCAGCTNHAIAMLPRYKTIIGAAKMHMFMMSVVGVITAAMMKITRIE